MKQRHYNIPASYLVLKKGTKILLLRRYNTGYEDGNYSMIAGHVNPKETFTQCIIREAFEEAGIKLYEDDISVAHVLHRNSGASINNELVDVFFVAEKWDNKIVNKEPDKCDDLSWFEINNLPNNTIPYIKHVINKIENGIIYSEIGW